MAWISRFRTPIRVECPKTAEDGSGHVDLSNDANWQCAGQTRAYIRSRGGRESRVFDQIQAETTHLIEMRADPLTRCITPKWRLRQGNRKFNITSVVNVDERNRTIMVEAIEAK